MTRVYETTRDNPYYQAACAALVSTDPMNYRQILDCRIKCARCIKHIRKRGMKRQVQAFIYHMAWVSYPLKRRPNGKWL